MVAHIPEILGQGDSCNKDNNVLQFRKEFYAYMLSERCKETKLFEFTFWWKQTMEVTLSSRFTSLLPFFFVVAVYFFSLSSFLFMNHSHVFLWRDTAMSLLFFPLLKPWTRTLLTVKCLLPFQTTRIQEWEKVVFYLNYLTSVHKKEL